MGYKAFISYKHGRSSAFARQFELSLKRYARRLFSRPMKIFRDENHFVPGVDLPRMISKALEDSEFLIVLASPGAAQSIWVRDEILEWCAKPERVERVIIVLTEGKISTSPNKEIDWDNTDALPAETAAVLKKVPYYIDLSWCVAEHDFDLSNPRFKQEVNRISARLRNVDPNDMLGIEVKEYRRSLRIRNIGIGMLTMFSLVAVSFGMVAQWQGEIAKERQEQAQSNLARSYVERGERAWQDRDVLEAEISFASALSIRDSRETREAYLEVLSRGVEVLWTAPAKLSGSARVVSSDGQRLIVAGADKTLRTYDVATLRQLSASRSPVGQVGAMAAHPAAGQIALGGSEGALAVWASIGNRSVMAVSAAHSGGILALELATGDGSLISVGDDNRIKTWSSSGALLREFSTAQPQLTAAVIQGGRVFAGDSRGSIRILDVRTGEELRRSEVHQSGIGAIAVNLDGHTVASWGNGSQLKATSDRSVRIWKTESGAEIETVLPEPGFPQAGSLAFSPDGKTLAIGSSDLHLWPLEPGASGPSLRILKANGAGGLVFEPGGRYLFSGGDHLQRWNLESGREDGAFLGHGESVASAAFSPDGARIVSGSFDDSLRVRRASDGIELWSVQWNDSVAHVEFSPDGGRIIGCTWAGFAALLDGETGAEIQRLPSIGSTFSSHCAAFDPQGRWLAVLENSATLALYPPAGGSVLRRIDLPGPATGLIFRGRGESLLISRQDGSIVELDWDGTEKRVLRSGLAPALTNQNFASAPNGRIVAATTAEEIVLWNMDEPDHPKLVLKTDSTCQGLAFTPDGQRLASAHYGYVQVWNTFSGKQLVRLPATEGRKTWMSTPTFSPDGHSLLLGDQDADVRLVSFENGALARTLRPPDRHMGDINFAPDPAFLSEEVLALSGYDGHVRAWEIASGRLVWETKLSDQLFRSMVFDPAASRLLLTGQDGSIFELVPPRLDARVLTRLEKGEGGPLAAAPNGQFLAFSKAEGESGAAIDVRTADGGTQLANLKGHHRFLMDLEFGRDGRMLVSTSYDRSAILWNLDDWQTELRLDAHGGTVTDADFDPRGGNLATACRDGFLRIFALPGGALEQSIKVMAGRNPYVESLSYGAAGAWLAAGGSGNAIVWDTGSWDRVVELRGHEDSWMHKVEFSPETTWLLTASSDEAVRVWHIPTLKHLLEAPPAELLALSTRRTALEPLSRDKASEAPRTLADFFAWLWRQLS